MKTPAERKGANPSAARVARDHFATIFVGAKHITLAFFNGERDRLGRRESDFLKAESRRTGKPLDIVLRRIIEGAFRKWEAAA